ncbi:MAG: HEPN domain-containing protein [Planctomycetes bacterium]|nr:HEPN domain-containing protein [Planctomycetota bacterium]
MRAHDEVKRELVREWLTSAGQDLDVARYLLTQHTSWFNTICFHAQQAAEKFLKAILVHHQVEFTKTHDLKELLRLVGTVDAPLADSLASVRVLTPYAIQARYPSEIPHCDRAVAESSVNLAAACATAVRAALADSRGEDPRSP